jgi:ring-1,2-phenylacetyl-CoA epoxidase subunit PaaC
MEARLKYYLQIADTALILIHRLGEYSSCGPFLEEDLATTNVALDLLGIAESMLNQSAILEGKGRTGDDLAYRREEKDYLNCLLVEQPNVDFAHVIVRQFFSDAFHFYFFTELVNSKDSFLSAIAVKSLKETTYHLRRSSEWMIRLGTGTREANTRTQRAVNSLWKYTNDFFLPSACDLEMFQLGYGVNLESVQLNYLQKVKEIVYMSHLNLPENGFSIGGGKQGTHTEHLGYILAEMQYLPSKYPDAVW